MLKKEEGFEMSWFGKPIIHTSGLRSKIRCLLIEPAYS